MVLVKYTGKRLPWTISMPWLNVSSVTFGETREAEMVEADAERLCAENPTDFEIVGVIKEKPESVTQKPPRKTNTKKQSLAKQKTKKKE